MSERKPAVAAKGMPRKDFELLRKIMDRTRSENDGEALASLRAANRIIERCGVSWERFFDRAVRVDVEQDPARPPVLASAGRDNNVHGSMEEDPERRERSSVVTRDYGAGLLRARIEEAFRAIDARNYKDDFVESLRGQWEDKGWLSKRQVEKLEEHMQIAKYR